MARPVLGAAFAWVWFSFGAPVHAAPVSCYAKNPNVQKLRQHLSASPFYRAMSARYGKAVSCTAKLDGGKISMAYAFRSGARVSAEVDPSVEYAQERADIRSMDEAKAMTLLKDAERYANRPDGCGMEWSNPEEERSATAAGSRDVIYRGSACNCQARLIYKDAFVVALIVRSAC